MEREILLLSAIPTHNWIQVLNQMPFMTFMKIRQTTADVLKFTEDHPKLFRNPLRIRKGYLENMKWTTIGPFIEISVKNSKDLVNLHFEELHLKSLTDSRFVLEECVRRRIKAKTLKFSNSTFIPELISLTGAKELIIDNWKAEVDLEDDKRLRNLEHFVLKNKGGISDASIEILRCKTAKFYTEKTNEKQLKSILKRFFDGDLHVEKWEFSMKMKNGGNLDLDVLLADLPSLRPFWCRDSPLQTVFGNKENSSVNPAVRAVFSLTNNQGRRIVIRIDDSSILLKNWPESRDDQDFVWDAIRLFR